MKPFEGIRVLDLTHVLAGPFSTYQLAVLGADVIKIESPNRPDMTREEGLDAQDNAQLYGSYFQAQNAGKRSLVVDLASDSGKDILLRLLESADVLVQNYAAGALDKLGFSYSAVSARNPKLIYCSISGFGSTGRKADHPAYDVVIQAYSGLMAANGEADSAPVRVGPPMVDYGTGAQAALAISAALFQRANTGKGQLIDVSMLDAALMLMTSPVRDTVLTDKSPVAHGNQHPHYAGYGTYDTGDGLLMIGAWTNKQLASLLDVLGESERAGQIRETARKDVHLHVVQDRLLIAGHLASKTADQWEHIFNDAHVPAARVRTMHEAINSAQVESRSVMQLAQNSAGDSNPVNKKAFPVAAFSYEHGGPTIDIAPPRFGEHTDQILLDAGYSDVDINTMRNSGVVV